MSSPEVTDADDSAPSSLTESEQAAVALTAIARQQELRDQVRRSISQRLDGTDTAMLIGIGLLGALPAQLPASMPAELARILGGAVQTRQKLAEQLLSGQSPPVQEVLDLLGHHSVGGIQIASLFGKVKEAGVLPDMKDLASAGSMNTATLSSWWCRHRGWQPGSQPFHEAKALAFAVHAVASAFFTSDPLAFGLAAWHGWKAIRASQRLTEQLREFVELNIASAKVAMQEYDDAVTKTELSRLPPLVARPFGAVDDIGPLLTPAERIRS